MIDVNALKKFLFGGGLIYLDGTDAEIASALKYLFFESEIQDARQNWFGDYFTAENEWNGNSFENWKFVLIDRFSGRWNMYRKSHHLVRSPDVKIIRFSEICSVFQKEDGDLEESSDEVSLSGLYDFM